MDKIQKDQKEARRRQEDRALNRGLLWVLAAIVFECLLFAVNRWYINPYISEAYIAAAVLKGLMVARIAGAVLGVCGVVWTFVNLKNGKHFTLSVILTLAFWTVALCCHVLIYFRDAGGIKMLYLLIPAFAGLALVYYLYQRELFLSAVASGAAAVGLWFVRCSGISVETILCAVVVLLVAVFTFILKKNNGVLPLVGKKFRILAQGGSNCNLIFASCAVGIAAMALALVAGSNIAYYLVFAMAVWIFALLVYYTVKLM